MIIAFVYLGYKQISPSNLVANQITRAGYTLFIIRTIAGIVRKLCPVLIGQSPQTRTKLYTVLYDREVKKPYTVQRHILVKAI